MSCGPSANPFSLDICLPKAEAVVRTTEATLGVNKTDWKPDVSEFMSTLYHMIAIKFSEGVYILR